MADVAAVVTPLTEFNERNCHIVTWSPLTAANAAGSAVQMAGSSDRCVQFIGAFDSATVVLQGSNDGTNWVTLTDPQGNAISKTSAGIEQIMELTRYVRPSSSGGGGSQSVGVILFLKKAR